MGCRQGKAASGPTVGHDEADHRGDPVLIRDPRRAASRHPAKVDICSGDAVFLRSHTLGRFLDVQGESVFAEWRERAPLQKLTIEGESVGAKGESVGAISSGDQVYLRALSGRYLEVSENGVVSATGQVRGARSALTVHKKDAMSTQAQIFVGDVIHFVANLSQGQKQLGVDHAIHGGVHARWADQKGDEDFVVEVEDMPSFQMPCGVRLVTESTKSEKEWGLACLHLQADVGYLAPPGGRRRSLHEGEEHEDASSRGAGPCTLVQSGSAVAEALQAPRVFGPFERFQPPWPTPPPWRGRRTVSAVGGAFHLGVSCQTPLPVHTVNFVQADEEHAAETVLLQEQVADGSWRTICRHRAQPAGVVDKLLEPVGVVGFDDAAWDALFGAGILGSNYDLTDIGDQVTVAMPVDQGPALSFRNATAALAAMKFWDQRQHFTELDGPEAHVLSQNLSITAASRGVPEAYDDIARKTSTFGGVFASEWTAMMAVQRAKFRGGSMMASALVQTGDTFLLAHSGDGQGRNILGMQLMLLRDELAVPPRGGPGSWTEFISDLHDVSTGAARGKEAREGIWRILVRDAHDALVAQKFPEQERPRCNAVNAVQAEKAEAKDAGKSTFLQMPAMEDKPIEAPRSEPESVKAAVPTKRSNRNKMSLAYQGSGFGYLGVVKA